ncbi:hypothetical protein Pcinc_000228 [Petrolisthes cinctipes]|uniref:Uncharacterized protein n=1 Tax=Petrolisthes cinctipes TaxID=88211 RepID=A0AAE1GMM7_PETCI|nr:hypothetical protein Pcinc_000228 [Petrolisthes cinctipes]
MKCVIPGVNIKVFGRAIHSLAKIGDELYIEPQTDGVSFRTVNSSRSAFASFVFGKAFFTLYDDGAALGIQEQQHDGGDDVEDDDSVKCKVPMKSPTLLPLPLLKAEWLSLVVGHRGVRQGGTKHGLLSLSQAVSR